ncbi:MAG TPA: UvrD-helicase domain-containing protein, partial [Blastocatellia bacterium]|nr:UvrD-helicase domain-containing protein [Blastocatellia bacterium]
MDFLASLNPQQLEAVKTLEGPLLVLAGAGSGKTRVITCRIAYLIQKGVARPDQILAVTFTNKAAEEMRSRIAAMLGAAPRTSSPLISTFHSLCVRILRRDIDRLESGYGRNFTIYDEDDQSRLVRAIMKDLSIDEKRIAIRQAMSAISWAKNHRTPAENYFQRTARYDDRKELIGRIYKLYEQRLHQANACDFDDLLIKGVELLRRSAEVRDYYRSRFQHLMVDEFQDTNAIQYDLARLIAAGPQTERVDWSGRSLCVVGDIDQSIYAFRGSDFNIILGFQKVFDGTRLIRLEQNYRSTQRILDAANSVIENNQQRLPKNLVATEHLGKGDTIKLYGSYDAEDEAAFVARKIEEHVY